MYNTHPTIIDQNSRFYNENAKLSCIFNDISAKQESIITQSAPEQVIWVWGIASEGARWDFGLLSNMPMPEAHEPRVGLAVHLAICNRGCEPEGVFIDLTIQLKNAPSSEPDAGERHVPYAVFKPIKDGITNWIRDIGKKIKENVNNYGSNPNQGLSLDGVGEIIFGPFAIGFTVLLTVLEAVMCIVTPFLTLVSSLLTELIDFLKPMIINAFTGGGKEAGTLAEDGWNCLTNWIYNYIGIESSGDSKADEEFYNTLGGFVDILKIVFGVLSFIRVLKIAWGSAGLIIKATFGLILTLIGIFGTSLLRKIDLLIVKAIGMYLSWSAYIELITKKPGGGLSWLAHPLCMTLCLISTFSFALYGFELYDLSLKGNLNLFDPA